MRFCLLNRTEINQESDVICTIVKTVACAWQVLVEMHQEYKKRVYMYLYVSGWTEKIPKVTHTSKFIYTLL